MTPLPRGARKWCPSGACWWSTVIRRRLRVRVKSLTVAEPVQLLNEPLQGRLLSEEVVPPSPRFGALLKIQPSETRPKGPFNQWHEDVFEDRIFGLFRNSRGSSCSILMIMMFTQRFTIIMFTKA